jgi:hypothetical protein
MFDPKAVALFLAVSFNQAGRTSFKAQIYVNGEERIMDGNSGQPLMEGPHQG